jgi:hypothetical protein
VSSVLALESVSVANEFCSNFSGSFIANMNCRCIIALPVVNVWCLVNVLHVLMRIWRIIFRSLKASSHWQHYVGATFWMVDILDFFACDWSVVFDVRWQALCETVLQVG